MLLELLAGVEHAPLPLALVSFAAAFLGRAFELRDFLFRERPLQFFL